MIPIIVITFIMVPTSVFLQYTKLLYLLTIVQPLFFNLPYATVSYQIF
jgi:hypothetical protein